jgi:hypothetical protein
MNCKVFVRKRSWPNFKVLSRYSRGGTEKTTEISIRITGRQSNPGSPRSVNQSATTFGVMPFETPKRTTDVLNQVRLLPG